MRRRTAAALLAAVGLATGSLLADLPASANHGSLPAGSNRCSVDGHRPDDEAVVRSEPVPVGYWWLSEDGYVAASFGSGFVEVDSGSGSVEQTDAGGSTQVRLGMSDPCVIIADHPVVVPPQAPPPAFRPLKRAEVVVDPGGRVDWADHDDLIAIDRRNPDDDYFDLYLMRPNGEIVASLTDGRPGIHQRHNGNGVWHPSGDYVVFLSEEPEHYGGEGVGRVYSEPGIGLFNNLWTTTPDATRSWRLTDIPIKRTVADGIPAIGTVNPHFSHTGTKLVWTERFEEGGNWGKWRIKWADFVVGGDGVPRLDDVEVLFEPEPVRKGESNNSLGVYVTALDFSPDDAKLLMAGNLEGQHEFGMDQYVFDLATRRVERNLHNTPDVWEEDACWSRDGRVVFMTNIDSPYRFVRANPLWQFQPKTREYWVMDPRGHHRQRLTWFNHPDAPEYQGRRSIVADCDFAPDGRRMAGLIAINQLGAGLPASIMRLQIAVFEFEWGS